MALSIRSFLGALLGVLPIMAAAADERTALVVDTAEVVVRERIARTEWNGIVQAVQDSALAAQVQGRIEELPVKAGDVVKAGQVLAVIDARETAAGLAQAKARLAQARAAEAGARSAHERNQRLYEQGFISKSSLDTTATQLAAASAGVAEAQAVVQRQSVTGTYTTIRAPYEGVIAEVLVELGEIAQPGRELMRMHAPDALRVSLRVPTRYASRLNGDSRAVVQLADAARDNSVQAWSEPLPIRVMPGADPSSATVELRVELPQPIGEGLRPGAYLRVATFRPAGQGLYVPVSAVLVRGELKVVYVVVGDAFVLRAVRLGPLDGDGYEVLSGVEAGERVAIDPVRAGLLGARPAGTS
ncbi:MAG: efflux RND transporter periplasmic adaptor subunit [Burkholderiaceae bacterium]